jgi:hypothetical protein
MHPFRSPRRFLSRSLALAGLAFAGSPPAHASEYGCKVLLCLANPNGPMAVNECVPPIRQLYHDLARGRPFPACEMAEGPGGKSYARQGLSHYDFCPVGTTELAQGSYAIQGASAAQTSSGQPYAGPIYNGIGSGDGITPGSGDGASPLPAKICVGKQLGTAVATIGTDDGRTSVQSGVYDRVVKLDGQASPRIIDVFIDNQLYRRVRW